MHAQAEYSILVILQGLDASGKDGVLNDVFRSEFVRSTGCSL